MSLNPVGSFDNSLAKFRSTLTENQKEEFKFNSIEDVKHAIQQIQDRIGPEKRLRNFTRIKKFLEGMKQVEELVKVFINASEVVAFIWVIGFSIFGLNGLSTFANELCQPRAP